MKPLGFFEYNKLQKNAFCVISDSGTITEESSLLGFPAITIREAHERPEGMDFGTLIMSDLDKESMINAIDITTSRVKKSHVVEDYDKDNISDIVLNIIISYTSYINKNIWKK